MAVDPQSALWDGPLAIVVSHVRPYSRVLLRAAATDFSGARFTSITPLQADSAGRVALQGATAARVLWSMHPVGAGPADYYVYEPPLSGEHVRLTLELGRRAVASASFSRRLLARGEHILSLRPAATGFFGEFFDSEHATIRRPAILFFGGSEGGLSLGNEAALLAAHGYPTLALAYFAAPGLPRNLVRIPLEYFAGALRWLQHRPGVDPTRLVVAGVSRGSEAAQLLGVHYPNLVHGVVALVPSNTPVCGIPRVTSTTPAHCLGPAWTWQGKAIPYSEAAAPYATPEIPDERIDGPILLACGGRDTVWPSCPMAHAIVARLRGHRFPHAVTLLDYGLAGHAVGMPLPDDPTYLPLGGTIAANQQARADAWLGLLAFLGSLR